MEADAGLLRYKLSTEVRAFEDLATAAGLPWIDKQMFRDELLRDATPVKLPLIVKLNGILRRQCSIGREIAALCAQREAMIDDMVTNYCGCGKQRIACSQQLHMSACDLLRRVDETSDRILHLAQEWRKNAAHPLPIVFHGENYICRMAHQSSHGNCIAAVTSHLRATCRFMPFFYSSSYDPVMTDANKVLQRQELLFMHGEREVQLAWCQSQLLMARMGMYAPVLRFRPNAKARVSPCIMIDNVKWKHQLILSYSNAYQRLEARQSQDNIVLQAANQLAHMLTSSLRQRYFIKWADKTHAAKLRRQDARELQSLSSRRLLEMRFSLWVMRAEGSLSVRRLVLSLMERHANSICRRFMERWFRTAVLSRVRRQAKRSQYLSAFHRWMLLGMRVILRQQVRTSCPFLQAVLVVGEHCTSREHSTLRVLASTAVLQEVPEPSQADPPPTAPAEEPSSSADPNGAPTLIVAEEVANELSAHDEVASGSGEIGEKPRDVTQDEGESSTDAAADVLHESEAVAAADAEHVADAGSQGSSHKDQDEAGRNEAAYADEVFEQDEQEMRGADGRGEEALPSAVEPETEG